MWNKIQIAVLSRRKIKTFRSNLQSELEESKWITQSASSDKSEYLLGNFHNLGKHPQLWNIY